MADHKRPESMERITTPALAEQFIAEQVAAVRAQVGDKKVLLALSGGVDSSVVAALLIKAVGKQLTASMSTMAFCGRENPSRWWKYSGIRWTPIWFMWMQWTVSWTSWPV